MRLNLMDHQAIPTFDLGRHKAPTEMFAPSPPPNARPFLENGTKHGLEGGEVSGSLPIKKMPSQGIVTDSGLLGTDFLKGDGSALLRCYVEETVPIESSKVLLGQEEESSTDDPLPDSSSFKLPVMEPSLENSPTKFEAHGAEDKDLIEREEPNVFPLLPGDEDRAIGCQPADMIANWPMEDNLAPDLTEDQRTDE